MSILTKGFVRPGRSQAGKRVLLPYIIISISINHRSLRCKLVFIMNYPIS